MSGRGGDGEPPVLILTGAPGVGKTTTARILAARSGRSVHVEADLFFHFIRSGYVEPWRPESLDQNRLVMRIVAEAAAGYAGDGYFTIIDGIVIPRWFLRPLRDSLLDAGHAVAYAVLRAPLSVCASRAGARERHPLAEPAVIERLWHHFADLGVLESHAIDIDTHDPEKAADLVAERLGGGSLAT